MSIAQRQPALVASQDVAKRNFNSMSIGHLFPLGLYVTCCHALFVSELSNYGIMLKLTFVYLQLHHNLSIWARTQQIVKRFFWFPKYEPFLIQW